MNTECRIKTTINIYKIAVKLLHLLDQNLFPYIIYNHALTEPVPIFRGDAQFPFDSR